MYSDKRSRSSDGNMHESEFWNDRDVLCSKPYDSSHEWDGNRMHNRNAVHDSAFDRIG